MIEEEIAPEIAGAIAEGRSADLIVFFQESHPTEAAEVLTGLEPEKALEILNLLPPQVAADIFCELPKQFQTDTAALLDRKALAALIGRLSPDDRVDLLKSLPDERFRDVLPALAQAERDDVKRLAAYPEGTVGSIMTTEYLTLPLRCTVATALNRLRMEAPKKESIYYSYIIDEKRKLLGIVSLRELILAEPGDRLAELMNDQVISVGANEDRQEATFKISRYDLIAIPVVDEAGALVGIVTHDDAIDVIEEEQTEDMERFMGISGGGESKSYLETSTISHFRHRVIWLIVLAAFGLVSGAVIQGFQSALVNLMILAFYMPMLAGTGGNTGSQSATMVVRALALKEIDYRDAFKVLWKELRVSLLLGLILGVFAFLRVMFFTSTATLPGGIGLIQVGLAISTALCLQVVSSTVIGAALPLIAARFKADPALIASPALTTVVDITGLLIYFGTARIMLGV